MVAGLRARGRRELVGGRNEAAGLATVASARVVAGDRDRREEQEHSTVGDEAWSPEECGCAALRVYRF